VSLNSIRMCWLLAVGLPGAVACADNAVAETAKPSVPVLAAPEIPEATEAPVTPVDLASDVPAAAVKPRPFEGADLEPYFSAGARREAKQAYDNGQFRLARKKLDALGDELPIRYLKALASLKSGDAATASEELSALADAYVPMRDACLYYAGLAEERRGHTEAALSLFQAVDTRSREYAVALMAASRLLSSKGQWAKASSVLAPLLAASTPDEMRAEALWTVASLDERQKDRTGARAALLRLWSLGPKVALSSSAWRRLNGAVTPEARVDHAEALIEANFGASGMSELRPLLKRYAPPDALGCRAHFLEGKALRKARRHALAVAQLTPVVSKCEDKTLKARALYVLGYSQSIIDAPSAVSTYETLAREIPDSPLAPDALFLAAELRARIGDSAGALMGYEAVTQQHPDTPFAAEALFRAFLIDWQARDYDGGLAHLEMLELSHRSDVLHRARYWHARALEQLGRGDEAKALVAALAADGTAGYYGEMARKRLAEVDPARVKALAARSPFATGADVLWPLDPGALAEEPRFRAGVELVRLGLPGAAAELLAIDRTKLPPAQARLVFQVLYQGGYVQASALYASATLNEDVEGELAGDARLLWELTFPKTFRQTIEHYSKASRVDPDLLQALIREESHFAIHARSSTGALGLAQVMPGTARQIATSLRLHSFTTASLLNPERNILIGSAYLSQLLRQFDGNRILAVAAYNAGPGAVRRWLAQRPDVSTDEWVEEIPVQETRDYVKKVIGSCRTYGQLYDTDWPQMLAEAGPQSSDGT
jgi:soluble lytic murein transglycosylase